MLLPFLRGRHDPLAPIVSAAATALSFGSLLLVPIGIVWLTSARAFVPATAVIANAAELIGDIERFRGRTGVYPRAISSLWPDYAPGVIGVDRFDLLQLTPEHIRQRRGYFSSEDLPQRGWRRFLFD